MDALSEKSVQLLIFLLPGFLAAWIFYGLTAHPRREPFERVVQGLVFTFIVKVEVVLIHAAAWIDYQLLRCLTFGLLPAWRWSDTAELFASAVAAVVTGLAFAALANNDRAHRFLRERKITKRTSFPSEWYSGFHRFQRDVILHLKGERRIRGFPEEWPDQSDRGHFLLSEPQWVSDSAENFPLSLIERIMIPAAEVELVEFLFDLENQPAMDVIEAQNKALVALQEPKEKTDER